jgi:hypothetical protein
MRGVIHDDDMDSDAAQKVQSQCVFNKTFIERNAGEISKLIDA